MRAVIGWMVTGLMVTSCGLDLGEEEDPPPPEEETPLLVLLGVCDSYDPDVCGTGCSTEFVTADIVETLRPGFVQSCADDGGRIVEVCSTNNAIGTCTVTTESAIGQVTSYTHNPDRSCGEDPAPLQNFCEDGGGTWE